MLVGFKTGDTDFGTLEGTGGHKTAAHDHNHEGWAVAAHSSHAHELPITDVEGKPDRARFLDNTVFGSGTSKANNDYTNIMEDTAAANVTLSVSIAVSAHSVTQPTVHSDHNILNPFFTVYMWKRKAYMKTLQALILFIILPIATMGYSDTITKGLVDEEDSNKYDVATSTFTRGISRGGTIILNKVGYEVDALMVYGGGVNYTRATIASALTSIGTTNKVTLVLRPGTWLITDNLTIPNNINLRVVAGALLSISTTKTFTVNGFFEAGLYQVFNCVGTGKVVFGTGSVMCVRPEWYAVNTTPGTTDMSTAMKASIVAAVAIKAPVQLVPGQKYAVVNLTPYDTLRMEGGGGAFQGKASLIALGGGSIFVLATSQTTDLEFEGIYFDSDTVASGTAIYGAKQLIARAQFHGCVFSSNLRYGLDCSIISSDFSWNQFGTYPATPSESRLFSSIRSGVTGGALILSNANTFFKNEFALSNAPFNISIDGGVAWHFFGCIFEQNTNSGQTILVDRYGGAVSFVGGYIESNTTPYFIEVRISDPADLAADLVRMTDVHLNSPVTSALAYFPDYLGTVRLALNGTYGRLNCNLTKDASGNYNTIYTLAESNNNLLTVGTGAVGVFEVNSAHAGYTSSYVSAPFVTGTNSATASTATATPVTIFTAGAGDPGVWLISAWIKSLGADYIATATFFNDSTAYSLLNYTHGSKMTITISGTSVQLTQTSGSNQIINYSIMRIGL